MSIHIAADLIEADGAGGLVVPVYFLNPTGERAPVLEPWVEVLVDGVWQRRADSALRVRVRRPAARRFEVGRLPLGSGETQTVRIRAFEQPDLVSNVVQLALPPGASIPPMEDAYALKFAADEHVVAVLEGRRKIRGSGGHLSASRARMLAIDALAPRGPAHFERLLAVFLDAKHPEERRRASHALLSGHAERADAIAEGALTRPAAARRLLDHLTRSYQPWLAAFARRYAEETSAPELLRKRARFIAKNFGAPRVGVAKGRFHRAAKGMQVRLWLVSNAPQIGCIARFSSTGGWPRVAEISGRCDRLHQQRVLIELPAGASGVLAVAVETTDGVPVMGGDFTVEITAQDSLSRHRGPLERELPSRRNTIIY